MEADVVFEKDYIMRSIRQFGAVLSRVLSKISRGDTSEAGHELAVAAETYLGLHMEFLLGMTNETVLDMYGRGGSYDIEKLYVVAQLLFCEANKRNAEGIDGSTELYLRSLGLLLLEYPLMDEEFEDGATPSIKHILESLVGREFPPEICEQLVLYHEARGEYADAENRLFDLADHDVDSAYQFGESFYARILDKTDRELHKGRLPRDEAEEGLDTFRSRYST